MRGLKRAISTVLTAVLILTALPVDGISQVNAAAAKTVKVDPSQASTFNDTDGDGFGEFEGWGTSLSWWANRLGYNETLTREAAEKFFGDSGLDMNIGRYNVGGGDDTGNPKAQIFGISKQAGVLDYNGNEMQIKEFGALKEAVYTVSDADFGIVQGAKVGTFKYVGCVSQLGSAVGDGDNLHYTVNVSETGDYTVKMVLFYPNINERDVAIKVNNGTVKSVSKDELFNSKIASNGENALYLATIRNVRLNAGINTINVGGKDGWTMDFVTFLVVKTSDERMVSDTLHAPHITRSDSAVPGYCVDVTKITAGMDKSKFARVDEESGYAWNYDWDADKNQMNILNAAKQASGNDFLAEAFSNSPPYFMTNSGCSSGAADANKDNLKANCYGAFAAYMADVIVHWAEEGSVEFTSTTPMNEPYTGYWGAYSSKQEGCHFDQGESQSTIIEKLNEELQRQLKATTNENVKKVLSNLIISGTDETSIDTAITSYGKLSENAQNIIQRIDTHTYGGSKRAELCALAESEGKNLWMSEVDGAYVAGTDAGEMGAALGLAQRIMTDLNGMKASAWILWNAVDSHADANNGPDKWSGGNDFASIEDLFENVNLNGGYWGIAFADHNNNELRLTKKYYAYGQFSRYIRPGYTIMGTSDASNTLIAYDPQGKKVVIVAVNTADSQKTWEFDLSEFRKMGSTVKAYRTSGNLNGENWADVSSMVSAQADTVNRKVTANLSANSITTFIVQDTQYELDTEYKGYLWTKFDTHEGYEKVFFAYSEDGLTWDNLNKVDGAACPILTNDAVGSDLGVRDPHIIRSPEGDRYWILGADCHAEGGGPGGSGWNQTNASQKIVVWESTDLVNWSEPRLVYAGFADAGCVWAPEAIYDDANKRYVVYWSARDTSKVGTDQNALRVYVCTTQDFQTFSTPKVWLSEDQDSGSEVNIIDTTIVKGDDGKYYRFSTSDWNTVIDVSDTLDTEDILDARVSEAESKPMGSWKRLVTRSDSKKAGFSSIEGLTVYQLPDGRWCVMGEDDGYKAFVTNDLSSGKFTAVTTAGFLDGRFRHGTVMRLTAEEESRILAAFGDAEEGEVVLSYDFENGMKDSSASKKDGSLYGNAKIVYDSERKSNVLTLDGSDGTYAQIPTGFFDGRDVMTISMDVKSISTGIFSTFTYGKDTNKYNFLRVRDTAVLNAITVNGWNEEKEVKGTGAGSGKWQNVTIVIDNGKMKLYVDGKMVDENTENTVKTSNLGTDLLSYLGKSFYDDPYFNGSFDNFKVYNRVLSESEIIANAGSLPLLRSAVIGTAPDRATALTYRGTDDHTAVFTDIDKTKKEITSYVRTGTNLKNIPVTLDLLSNDASVMVNGREYKGGNMDLSSDVTLKISLSGKEETYTIKTPQIAHNPVLPGQYTDPDIDYFDGKFWIYPATDGYPGWSATQFHAFSSPDMVNWEDEGIIMELANDNPGVNDEGIQIASSPWAVGGSAWSPTIEKKNGKYYFYYCGKDSGGVSSIGVAVADNPAGPYTDKGEPLMTVAMCSAAGVSMGQAIDPSIFTDDDGTSYILFGNGKAAIAQLGDDMVSIKSGTLRQINGLTNFRESVFVTKANGKYHWTWSCDDSNSPNYHVNYGVSNKLTDSVTLRKENLLGKDESKGILGPGQQSVLHVLDANGKDRYFMAYQRFYTPVGIFTSADSLGAHRETCIDEIFFDVNGEMVITPTLEGVSEIRMAEISTQPDTDFTYNVLDDGTLEITRYSGTATDLTIPERIDGKLVTRIGAWVFFNKSSLVRVRLPESITCISMYAFDKCTSLTSINIPSRVTEIGFAAISDCNSLTSITIPSSVAEIGGSAFSGCNSLKSITVPPSVTKLEESTFSGCSSLESINLPNGLLSVGDYALSRCSSLKNITIPSSVTEFGKGVFYEDSNLESINLPNSLKSMGENVFWGCSALENISLPNGITRIESFTFSDCGSLRSIRIPRNVENIEYCAFSGCSSLRDVYYGGSKSQWQKIQVEYANEDLTGAAIHYEDEEQDNKPTSITLSSITLSLKKGSSKKLTYTLKPANASSAVTFTTNNPSVATVDKNGTVTAKKKGTATITANASGVKATCKVTVTEEVKLKTPSLTVKLNSANGVKLSWKKVSGAQGYCIYRSTSKNSGYKQIKKLKGTSYVNNKLKSGKTYYYKVAAYKGSTLSAKSKVKSKKIIGKLATPKVKISLDERTKKFTISWGTVKGASKIEIVRQNGSGVFKKWKTISAKKKDVSYAYFKPGTKYRFAVRAYYTMDGKKIYSENSKPYTLTF